MVYYMNKEIAALFVCDLLIDFVNDLQSITITKLQRSEAYSVLIVTNTSSGDAVKDWVQTNYLRDTSTSPENIPDGQFLPRKRRRSVDVKERLKLYFESKSSYTTLTQLNYELFTRDIPDDVYAQHVPNRQGSPSRTSRPSCNHRQRSVVGVPYLGSTNLDDYVIVYEGKAFLNYRAILEAYSIEELLELNDKTNEEAVDFLVTHGFIDLPEVQPLDFE